ncbi:DUF2628 domain-containing protein [Peptostreptococcus sp. D1]|uniref:DUF2628 domain-containing protein n=1 Tax=Peptostreptococcus sp. D1 TaxID=72304 RepID=UPI0008E81A29|nr:DUF2628 domain-containing protein [Peptostreptococcus sp. D1]SFE72368.1 Protein of unknown function [Peptostreptococcus sp. D1]
MSNENYYGSNAPAPKSKVKEMEDLELFVGKNTQYYEPRFEKYRDTDSKVGWNWVAFFFPVMWLCYRKMYAYAIGYFVLINAISQSYHFIENGVIPNFRLVIWLVFPLFANYIYYRFAKKRVEACDGIINEEERKEKISALGGTNGWAVVIAIVLSCAVAGTEAYIKLGSMNYALPL